MMLHKETRYFDDPEIKNLNLVIKYEKVDLKKLRAFVGVDCYTFSAWLRGVIMPNHADKNKINEFFKRPIFWTDYSTADKSGCEGCKHFKYYETLCEYGCHYVFDTGYLRDCPPGKGCTRKELKNVVIRKENET